MEAHNLGCEPRSCHPFLLELHDRIAVLVSNLDSHHSTSQTISITSNQLTQTRLVLYITQIGYVWTLFSSNADNVAAAAGVGSHFILNNLLQFAFIMLFVNGHYVWAEVFTIINFFNLSSLYFRHNTVSRLIHIPATSGPLAWTFVQLYWNGAIMVGSDSLPARILANIAIWGILVYGVFFLIAYKVRTLQGLFLEPH